MRYLPVRILPRAVGLARGLGIVTLIGFALALGACSKCDVPDFTHLGAPHVCEDGAPAQ